jgi:CheY-like chemotaxis protein
MIGILAGTFGLLLAACEPVQTPDTLVVSSDPELRALAQQLLPDLARRAGMQLNRPVRLERRSRAQLVRYLTAKLDQDLPREEAAQVGRTYALLGLVPADLDVRAILLSVYTEQVAGFYDPDSTALFVLDDQPAASLGTVLVHELVHAVQDQTVDLDSITARTRGNDRQAAALAAIEGHATLVMLEYMMESMQGSPVDLSRMPGFAQQLRGAQLEGALQQYPALRQAPRIIQEGLLFPYVEGAGFVHSAWQSRGGRPAPFGALLPQSTEQVLYPDRLLGTRDDPREVDVSVPGARLLRSDVLGRHEVELLLREHSGVASARADGWDGDRFVLVETSSGDALAWVSVWEDVAARDDFQRKLTPLLGRFGKPATLEARTVGRAPGLLLRVGEVGPVEATLPAAPGGGRGGSQGP